VGGRRPHARGQGALLFRVASGNRSDKASCCFAVLTGTGTRLPFLSAMSMLDAKTMSPAATGIRGRPPPAWRAPKEDMHALWRRIVFSILISNTDDHLRNHGFCGPVPPDGAVPAYDLNPVPTDIKPRILTPLSIWTTARLAEVGAPGRQLFELGEDEAIKSQGRWAGGCCVAPGGEEARLTPAEIDRMASAFEHQDLKAALALALPAGNRK